MESDLLTILWFSASGSYIFSQTIFTFRTGCRSRIIGVFIMLAYLLVCISTINILQIAPLFFLGATLIFIGYDLVWEWIVEIRTKLYLTEYIILLVTFVAIQVIGMDFGILVGVVVALIDHVGTTTRVSSLNRVLKRSRMVWSAETYNILQLHGYSSDNEKIVTLEIKGPVFFGSSQKLLQDITEEIGLDISDKELRQIALASPHTSTPHSSIKARKPRGVNSRRRTRIHPQYVVLDMTSMHNLDASAASSCFLQLAKLCEKRGIFLCAAGVLPRVEWMLRSHHVAYAFDDEIKMKNDMLSHRDGQWNQPVFDKLILFMTLFEVSTSGVYCLLNCSAIVCSTNSCMTRHLSSVNDFSFEE